MLVLALFLFVAFVAFFDRGLRVGAEGETVFG